MNEIIEYLLFIGLFGYLGSCIMFFYLFVRTLFTKDGIGLLFLRTLTLAISIGSGIVFAVRVLSEYGHMDFLVARAIAGVNPIILIAVGLYLNFLFHQKYPKKQGGL